VIYTISDAAAAPPLVLEVAHAGFDTVRSAPVRACAADGTYTLELDCSFRHKKGAHLINELINAPLRLVVRQARAAAAAATSGSGAVTGGPAAAAAARPTTPPPAPIAQLPSPQQPYPPLGCATIDLIPLGLGSNSLSFQSLELQPAVVSDSGSSTGGGEAAATAATTPYQLEPGAELTVSVALLQQGPAPSMPAAPSPIGGGAAAAAAAAAVAAAAAQVLEPLDPLPAATAKECNVLEVSAVSLAPLPPGLLAAQRVAGSALVLNAALLHPRGGGRILLPVSEFLPLVPQLDTRTASGGGAGSGGGGGSSSGGVGNAGGGGVGNAKEAAIGTAVGGSAGVAAVKSEGCSGLSERRIHLLPPAVEALKVCLWRAW